MNTNTNPEVKAEAITGHHHISMITKSAVENSRFYRQTLGLRMVKKTVNQDDPSMYHLFYGDVTGSPGTELTFFEMPMAGTTYRGTNAITRIGLLVPSEESLDYWQARLEEHRFAHSGRITYAGRSAVAFEDPEGLRFVLLNNNGDETPSFWESWSESPVPAEHQILGMGAVEVTVRNQNKFVATFTEMFGYTKAEVAGDDVILQGTPGKAYSEIVVKELDGPSERPGKGSIHHLAIRAKNKEELQYWADQVAARGFHSSGIVDRFYFQSLYFRESNGILIEIATDGPGFTVDQKSEELGDTLALPPFLEHRRAEIEKYLKPLN